MLRRIQAAVLPINNSSDNIMTIDIGILCHHDVVSPNITMGENRSMCQVKTIMVQKEANEHDLYVAAMVTGREL